MPRSLHARILESAARRVAFDVDPEVREHVANEQLRMVWLHSHIGIVMASGFAVLLAIYLAGFVEPAMVRAWIAVKLFVAGARLLQARAYARKDYAGGSRRRMATYASLAIDATVWGAAGFWLMPQSIPIASLVAASLACISCVATFGLQVSLTATVAYVSPIVLPTIAALWLRADDFGWFAGLGLLMLLSLQLATARSSEHRLAEGLLLRLRAQALAKEKDQALALALRQSAVKSQFLANISHELRTPMHGILGLARVLHLEIGSPALLRRVELIEDSGHHLLSLINDLLDISRIEAGQLTMRSEAFDLAAQVEQVAGVHAVRADDKGLQFVRTVGVAQPCWVQGDPARFRQVLHNLLGNAIKFTAVGEVALSVRTAPHDDSLVLVRVSDSGPGIAQDDLSHIFEAFRQSDGASAHPTEGAGLGLTIAREIARAMGGDVTAQSVWGEGATLTFSARLPRADAPVPEPHRRTPPQVLAAAGSQVLLAEDDDINALIATAYLERFGASVERVANGRQAADRALRPGRRPDLVLMDCRMPTMDGYAATREIRARETALGWPHLPVLALTATVTDADRQLCEQAGMDDFVAKPFTMDELATAMNRWLPTPQPAAPPPAVNHPVAATTPAWEAACAPAPAAPPAP